MVATTWIDIARGVAAVVQIVAIAVGGTWAYLKFVHGRTLVQRAELRVAGVLLSNDEATALAVTASMENTGAARIGLRRKAVYLYGAEPAFWSHEANLDWDCRLSSERGDDERPEDGAVRTTPVFARHVWLEPNETIIDTVLIPVPRRKLVEDHEWLAYRLELVVRAQPDSTLWRPSGWNRRRPPKRQRSTRVRSSSGTVKRWTATAVIPASLHAVARTHGSSQEQDE